MAHDIHFEGAHALGHFAHFLERQAERIEVAEEQAGHVISEVLYEKAEHIFGDNQKLAHLAQATQDERMAKGYTPDDPLFRDGSLLKSKVERMHALGVGAIGTPEKVQLYHEYGYVNARTGRAVPPRPVFRRALEESTGAVLAVAEMLAGAGLSDEKVSLVKQDIFNAPTVSLIKRTIS